MKGNKNRNYAYVKRIKQHAEGALKTFNNISLETFLEETSDRKAVLFDLFQVGELVSQMTKSLQLSLDKDDFSGIIAVRNHIVHGYDKLNNDIIINCLRNQLEPFVKQLEINAYKIYKQTIMDLLGEYVTVLVDHPIDEQNLLNTGHLRELSSPDYELQRVVIVDLNEPIFQCKCKVVGAFKKKNEDSYMLLTSLIDTNYNEIQIRDLIKEKLHVNEFELIVDKK